MSVWMRPLVNKEYAVAAVSYRTDGRPQPMHFTLREVGYQPLVTARNLGDVKSGPMWTVPRKWTVLGRSKGQLNQDHPF